MKPASFIYHAPRSLDEAVGMLGTYASQDGRVLAGGQSLVPAMALRLAFPSHLIDINGVAELGRLFIDKGFLVIGACVRHAAFERQAVEGPLGRLLAGVVRYIAHYPIRTRGTFCGSLAHADPASEWCLVAATLDAELVAQSTRGIRTIAARDYFQGLMTTALEADELLVEARLSVLASDSRFGFHEFSRRAGDFAIAMALATFRIQSGVIVEPRVAVGGAEAKPRRIAAAEATLSGRPPSPSVFAAAAEAAAAALDPLSDVHYSAGYRRDLVRTVVRRALEQA